jgi:hypothetical protein
MAMGIVMPSRKSILETKKINKMMKVRLSFRNT